MYPLENYANTITIGPSINKFDRNTYKSLCEEMALLLEQEREIAGQKEEIRNRIINMCGGDRMEYGIKIQKRQAKGIVDYKRLLLDLDVPESTCELYRKPDREYWEVKTY